MRRVVRTAVVLLALPLAAAVAPAAHADTEQVCVSVELREHWGGDAYARAWDVQCLEYQDLELDPVLFTPTTIQTPEACLLTLPCADSTTTAVDTPVVRIRQYPGVPDHDEDRNVDDPAYLLAEYPEERGYCVAVRSGSDTHFDDNPIVFQACTGTVAETAAYRPLESYQPLVPAGSLPVVSLGPACVGSACTPPVSQSLPLYTLDTTLPGVNPLPLRVVVVGTQVV